MKIEEEITLPFSREKIWEVLGNLNRHTSWNPWLQILEAKSHNLEEAISLKVNLKGSAKVHLAILSGYFPPKYLSFSLKSRLGSWWYQAEIVYRMTEDHSPETRVIGEVFCNGIGVKWGRPSWKRYCAKGLERSLHALKAEVHELKS